MSSVVVKEEQANDPLASNPRPCTVPMPVIELGSSDSDSWWSDEEGQGKGKNEGRLAKKRRGRGDGVDDILPIGFLDPLPPEEEEEELQCSLPEPIATAPFQAGSSMKPSRQFWKAGDYDGDGVVVARTGALTDGMDHVRVHPKFLHSNATSHKWALGAFAELIDNAMDEVCHGATFINIDVLENKQDCSKMILVEDNGGGMDPDKMRQCMSLGFSAKSKLANTIGQYGNGFKTSTMRLGADVIVFSRFCGKNGKSSTQSIGMLSYTFLRNTGKEDIVVPMLDYEEQGSKWIQMARLTHADWTKNLETIIQWSPYKSEDDLLDQFRSVANQGTRIVIFNLWENEHGGLELDFNTDKQDIQLGGVNRDEKKIQMAVQFPNSRHFLTYEHSLRSYASILYLRLPRNFRMLLRGKMIEHHNIANDMMQKEEVTYRPQYSDPNRSLSNRDLVAVVTIGFVKDAKDHIDVQGFNVYHKNRLIKPFWRVWNAAGSDGRGVIGVLEANFVEPAHDKQGFERTTVLSRLEKKLVDMQKNYWTTNCHRIGYAPRRNKKIINESKDQDSSSEEPFHSSKPSSKHASHCSLPSVGNRTCKYSSFSKHRSTGNTEHANHKEIEHRNFKDVGMREKPQSRLRKRTHASNESDSDIECTHNEELLPGGLRTVCSNEASGGHGSIVINVENSNIERLKEENCQLKERLKKMEESMLQDLQKERERSRSLVEKIEEAEKKLAELNTETEALIDIFSEERSRRDKDEESLRKKLREASATIQELLKKVDGDKDSKPRK